jgi:hypothetical protein
MAQSSATPEIPSGPLTKGMPTQYLPIYTPLNKEMQEIRLLTLLAGEESDLIRCELEIHVLDSCPEFEALSYFWGEPSLIEPVVVNDFTVKITHNLAVALRYLRRPQACRLLWIDALCINQPDTTERNHQVYLMNRLYSTAHQVVIWLGEATNESDAFIDHINNVAQFPTPAPFLEAEMLCAFENLLCRPWWSRIWVVQEAVLAKSDPLIQCGRKLVYWNVLTHGYFQELRKIGSSTTLQSNHALLRCTKLAMLRTTRALGGLGSLNYVLCLTKEFEATDPRDKIYGCIGLLEKSLVEHVRPDYRKSAKEVYLDVAKYLLNNVESNFFSGFSFQKTQRAFGPTWVPDFANQRSWSHTNPEVRLCNDRINLPRPVSFHEEDRVLAIEGISFDKILISLEFNSSSEVLLDQITKLERMMQHESNRPLPQLHCYRTLQRYAQIAEVLVGGFKEGDSWGAHEFDVLLGRASSTKTLPAFEHNALLHFLRLVLPGRYFFITQLGFAGVAVAPVRKNDIVTILSGEKKPIMLRPQSASYIMLGAGYVTGISDGQMLDLYRRGLVEKTVFKIR